MKKIGTGPKLVTKLVKNVCRDIFSGGFYFVKWFDIIEILMVQILEYVLSGFLELREVYYHAAFSRGRGPGGDLDFVVVAVQLLAFAFVIAQPMCC